MNTFIHNSPSTRCVANKMIEHMCETITCLGGSKRKSWSSRCVRMESMRRCRLVLAFDNIPSKMTHQLCVAASLVLMLLIIFETTTSSHCDMIICPKDNWPIYPCKCQNGTMGLLIKCANSNLATLSKSLKNIRDPIEQVEVENSTIGKLFGPLFSDSTTYSSFHSAVRELAVRSSGLRSIDASSFSLDLLKNIQYLTLDRNLLQQVPSDLTANLTNLRGLNLSSNSISNLESGAFAKLTNLTELDLSNNKIARIAKSALNSLNSLENLDLSGNELSKLDKNLFVPVRKLKFLNLSNNKLTSLDRQDFNELTALESLLMANNQLTTLPRSIFSRNAKLYTLDMSFNRLDDIDTYLFKSTRFLKELNIAGNQLKEITKNTFAPTTRIKRINIAQNQLQALAPETFKGLEWLEKIDLSYNQIVNISNDAFNRIFQVDIDLSHNKLTRIFYWAFHEVANMTRLDLSHNNINDGISLIAFDSTDCALLNLSHNQIQDISKIPISNLTGVRYLDISHNQITEFNKKSFTQKVPLYELHTIDASFNNISQISGNVLERLRSIRNFNISHNSLRRLTSGAFGNSPTLLELDLTHNNLVEIVAGTLVGLVSMKNLDLSHNRLKKMIPIPVALNSIHLEHNEISQLSKSAFPSLNSLLELYLDHNRLSNIEEGTFSTLLALHTLSLSHNNLSQVPVSALKDLTSLQFLKLSGNTIQRLGRKAFGTLPIVFELHLDANNISHVANHAFEGMLQLLSLNMSRNNLVELPPEAFSNLVSLRTLDLSNNQLNRFENKTRSAMEDLLSLEVANLSGNKLSLITPKTFLNSPYIPFKLTHLDLANNLIGILVQHFANGMKKIESLSLRNNIINEIHPGVFHTMQHLRYLDLSHNKLRQLKEGTFDAAHKTDTTTRRFINLTTILLNDNKLTSIHCKEFDQIKSLMRFDLSSNRLQTFYSECYKWIRRGLALDLRHNPLECSCNQLPLIAWADSFASRNYSQSMLLGVRPTTARSDVIAASADVVTSGNNGAILNAKLLSQFSEAVNMVKDITCASPDTMGGKPLAQMLDLVSTNSPSKSATLNKLNCDKHHLAEADNFKRLKAPIQYTSADPFVALDGQQLLRIGWSLIDARLDVLEFVIIKARFAQQFDLASYRFTASTSTPVQVNTKRASSIDEPEFKLVEHEIERVTYDERSLVLHNLDASQFYVVCITYESAELASSPGKELIAKLNSTGSSSAKVFANILASYDTINCISLNSLLQQQQNEHLSPLSDEDNNSERLVSLGNRNFTHGTGMYWHLLLVLLGCLAICRRHFAITERHAGATTSCWSGSLTAEMETLSY